MKIFVRATCQIPNLTNVTRVDPRRSVDPNSKKKKNKYLFIGDRVFHESLWNKAFFRARRSSKERLSPFKIRLAGTGESSFGQFHGPDREGGLAKYLITFELTYRYQGNRTSSRKPGRGFFGDRWTGSSPLFFGSPGSFPLVSRLLVWEDIWLQKCAFNSLIGDDELTRCSVSRISYNQIRNDLSI